MNIGDYVRTKDYGIHKISNLEHYDYIDYIVCENQFNIIKIDKSNIIKSSPSIIDLIKAGDYVNGKLVIEHAYQKGRLFVTNLYIGGKGFTTCEDYSWELTKEDEDLIETIVTKEQFESMEYRIGE